MNGLTYFLYTESVGINCLQGMVDTHSALTDLPQCSPAFPMTFCVYLEAASRLSTCYPAASAHLQMLIA
jgi:hypothetical protein